MKTHAAPPLVRLAFAAALFLTLAAPLCRAQSPVSIYARLSNGTGVWAGESTDPGRTGWTNLREVSFGADNSTGLSGTGTATFRSPALKKLVDRLSPQIFFTLASGGHLDLGAPNADLTVEFVRVVNSIPVVFFRVEMRFLFINSTSSSAAAGEDTLQESVTFSGGSMRYTQWVINPNGTQGASVTKSWNVVTNSQNF